MYAFGRGCLDQPEKVLRVLRMWNDIASDENLRREVGSGRRGVHWEYKRPKIDPETGEALIDAKTGKPVLDERGGTHGLGPYSDPKYAAVKLAGVTFFLSDPLPEAVRRQRPKGDMAYLMKYCNPKWSLMDVFLRPEVVPTAGEHLDSLRAMETTVFVDIIRGKRPLEAFEKFVEDWRHQGGERMVREANTLYGEMQWIFRQVGADSRRRVAG